MDINNFINEKGRVISVMMKNEYVSKNFPSEYKSIMESADKLKISSRSFSEKIYHYINKLGSGILCKNCRLNVPKYFGLVKGYSDYCSSKCSNGSEEVKKNKEESYIKKYGVNNPSKSKEIIQKINKTFIKNWGDNPAKIDSLKNKTKQTNLIKYGDESPLGKNSVLRKKKNEEDELKFRERYKDLDVIKYSTEKWGTCIIRCKDCNNNFEISKWNLHQRSLSNLNKLCTNCNPIGSFNSLNLEDFIKSILDRNKIEYRLKDRTIINPLEIDIIIDELNLGIEINGIYCHSSKFKSKSYHIEKTEKSADNGIKLIHIIEDEIVLKPELVKSRLLSILNIYEKKIYSRRCEIREVNKKESKKFLKENHLQGECGAIVRLGLFFNGELVSLMTFSKDRKSLGRLNKEGSWELIRFCNKLGYLVIGGASRLFKNFIDKYNPLYVTSFCDRRWSPDNNFYKNLGFNFLGNTPPNYWYYQNNTLIRMHRYNFRKDVLIKQGFDKEKTEFEIMSERNYMRVYDCGSSKWLWKNKKEEL